MNMFLCLSVLVTAIVTVTGLSNASAKAARNGPKSSSLSPPPPKKKSTPCISHMLGLMAGCPVPGVCNVTHSLPELPMTSVKE